MVDLRISPDDVCLVCNTQRDEHGDKHHKFSNDGQLIPLDPAPKPRQEAPKTREEAKEEANNNQPNLHLAFATLVEVLAEKQINFDGVGRELLTKQDIIRIFSGQG